MNKDETFYYLGLIVGKSANELGMTISELIKWMEFNTPGNSEIAKGAIEVAITSRSEQNTENPK